MIHVQLSCEQFEKSQSELLAQSWGGCSHYFSLLPFKALLVTPQASEVVGGYDQGAYNMEKKNLPRTPLLVSMNDDVIWIVTDEPQQVVVPDGSTSRDGRRLPNPFDESEIVRPENRGWVPVKVEKLEQGMADFLWVMGRVVRRAQQSATWHSV